MDRRTREEVNGTSPSQCISVFFPQLSSESSSKDRKKERKKGRSDPLKGVREQQPYVLFFRAPVPGGKEGFAQIYGEVKHPRERVGSPPPPVDLENKYLVGERQTAGA